MKTLYRFAAPFLLAILLIPDSARAQNWNAAEQEVIDFTDACWTTWFQENVNQYLSECWHEDITFWFSEHVLPFGARWVERAATDWFSTNKVSSWDIQVHTVKIHGNTAIIQYQLLSNERDANQEINHWAGGRTEVLLGDGKDWKVVAVHQHPAPISRK